MVEKVEEIESRSTLLWWRMAARWWLCGSVGDVPGKKAREEVEKMGSYFKYFEK